MSTLIDDTAFLPASQRLKPRDSGHQSNSWPILSALLRWAERRRQRNALRSRIDDRRLLDDIGLTREQVLREVNKAFWK